MNIDSYLKIRDSILDEVYGDNILAKSKMSLQVTDRINNYGYYLCNDVVAERYGIECSKPFSSGYPFDTEQYYVAVLDLKLVEKESDKYPNLNIWCRECVEGYIDVGKMLTKNIRKNGLMVELERVTGLTQETNIAIAIKEMSKKFKCNPIEVINLLID